MNIFRILLTALLASVIVLSTCGAIEFVMYLVFLRFNIEYQTLLITFVVAELCAFALLALVLHRFDAAAVAVAAGALFHLVLYALRWSNRFQMFASGMATDTMIILIMMTAAYASARKRVWTPPSGTESRSASAHPSPPTRTQGFWTSLDQASKVAIVTALITSLAGIVTTLIGELLKPH
jgi:hypothetical protein